MKIIPSNHSVQMASVAMKVKPFGFCVVNVIINHTKYEATILNVLENLCSNIILGLDFQSQHERLIFKFNGSLPELVEGNDMNCALTVADTKKALLFANLLPEVKPVATKSRRFSECDRVFIQKTIDDWLKGGIIQPNFFP